MGRRTLGEVWNRLGDPRRGPGRVGGPSRMSGTVPWTLGVGEPFARYGTGREPSGRSGTARGILGEVLDRSGDPREGRGRVGGL